MSMPIDQALAIAERVRDQLAPHCERIEIAGSVRRRCATVGDIEIVAIPKPYGFGFFASGIAPIVEAWPKIRGTLPCLYTRRRLPDGIELDLFFAQPENWGYILAIRTGSASFARELARGWRRNGYQGLDGMLWNRAFRTIEVREEIELFNIASVSWRAPEDRI